MSGQEEELVQQQTEEPSAQNQPSDLAEAFKMYNQSFAAPAQEAVDGAESQPEGIEEPDLGGEEPDITSSMDASGDVGVGGSADVVQPIDYNPARQQVLNQIQQNALQSVRKRYADAGIRTVTIKDLYENDQQSGRVTFKNPDDPRNPFTSRAEAQKWCEAFNAQVNDQFRRDINAEQMNLLKNAKPVLDMIEFAPRYDKMDKVAQDIFDDIIEPYGIKDNTGKLVGFRCDLNQAARQAETIAKRFNVAPSQTQEQKPEAAQPASSSPALDMKTGKSESKSMPEPKTIGEALKMFDQQQKGKK